MHVSKPEASSASPDALVGRILQELLENPPRTLRATGLDAERVCAHIKARTLEELGGLRGGGGCLAPEEQSLLAVAFSSRNAWTTLERINTQSCGAAGVGGLLTSRLLDAFRAALGLQNLDDDGA